MLRSLAMTAQAHAARQMNCLRATGLRLGLLVNFCAYPKVDIRRIAV